MEVLTKLNLKCTKIGTITGDVILPDVENAENPVKIAAVKDIPVKVYDGNSYYLNGCLENGDGAEFGCLNVGGLGVHGCLNVDGSLCVSGVVTADSLVAESVKFTCSKIGCGVEFASPPIYTGEYVDSETCAYLFESDNFITKCYVDQLNTAVQASLAGKADKGSCLADYCIGDAYTKSEVDTVLAKKADKSTTLEGYGIADAYTKKEVDTELAEKANSEDVYTKTEVDGCLATKANAADVYTQEEVTKLLKTKADYSHTHAIASIENLGDKLGCKVETSVFKTHTDLVATQNTCGHVRLATSMADTCSYAVPTAQMVKGYSDTRYIIGGTINCTTTDEAIAIGYNSKVEANSIDGVAIGANTCVNGNEAIAIGNGAYTGGCGAISIGCIANSRGESSIAIGAWSEAYGCAALAIGYCSRANANGTVAIGCGAIASTDSIYAIAIGMGAKIVCGSCGGITIGGSSLAGNSSVALGYGACATDHSVALGTGAITTGENSIVLNSTAGEKCSAAANTFNVFTGGGVDGFYVDGTKLTDSFACKTHAHAISDVTDLQTTLNGKASSSHTHTIANVSGLQSALDDKLSLGYTAGCQTIKGGIEICGDLRVCGAVTIPGYVQDDELCSYAKLCQISNFLEKTCTQIGMSACAGDNTSIAIGCGAASSCSAGVAIGLLASSSCLSGIAIGAEAEVVCGDGGISIGCGAVSWGSAIALGANSNGNLYTIAIGNSANARCANSIVLSSAPGGDSNGTRTFNVFTGGTGTCTDSNACTSTGLTVFDTFYYNGHSLGCVLKSEIPYCSTYSISSSTASTLDDGRKYIDVDIAKLGTQNSNICTTSAYIEVPVNASVYATTGSGTSYSGSYIYPEITWSGTAASKASCVRLIFDEEMLTENSTVAVKVSGIRNS